MCTNPLYAIRLKTEFDKKFQRFGKRTPIRVLKSVAKIGKDINKLDFDRNVYDLIMISCGQCDQCRLLKSKQRAIMCMCESLEHTENSFITLTFGYPQTYSYYRHTKGLSHYLASKKAHFHEWSLENETIQKFIKRLRFWYYNFQLTDYLLKNGYSHYVYTKKSNGDVEYFKVKSHIRIPKDVKSDVLKDFHPKKIRIMHAGEYGEKRQRPHHHLILLGFQFPDISPIYEKNQKYYTSQILSSLWTFGIHRIGDCTYNSCAYVARYVTKKVNGQNKGYYYNGRKPEYITYSIKPVLGANYFIKNYKEFMNTGVVSVVTDKLYECPIPKSYDNIVKSIDLKLFNDIKELRIQDCLSQFDKLISQKRDLLDKFKSAAKKSKDSINKLIRGFESEPVIIYDETIKKAKSFGVSLKWLTSENSQNAIDYLYRKDFKSHLSKSTNQSLHDKYVKFERDRKKHINACYNVNHSDERVCTSIDFFLKQENPFKCKSRGRSLPDFESNDYIECIDEKGESYVF